jgi:hypothetical protein
MPDVRRSPASAAGVMNGPATMRRTRTGMVGRGVLLGRGSLAQCGDGNREHYQGNAAAGTQNRTQE